MKYGHKLFPLVRSQEQHHKTRLDDEEEDGNIRLLFSPVIFYVKIYIKN